MTTILQLLWAVGVALVAVFAVFFTAGYMNG